MTDNQTPTPELSLRDDVRSAVESLKEKPEHADDAGKIADAERRRDEGGRFTKPEAKPTDGKRPVLTMPEKKPAEATGAAATGATPAQAATAPAPKYKAPDGWTAPMKAKFGELPEEVQAEITRRETEAHQRITANDNERLLGKQFREIAAPYQATLTAEGASIADAFKQFLNTAFILRTGTPAQKAQALQIVAQQFNVPIGGQLQQAPIVDPRLETLQQRIDRIERERQADTQQRQAQEQAVLASEIEGFRAAPGHDHFEKVQARMGHLLETGLAKDLQDAYDQACYSDPEIRVSILASAQSESEQKRQAELKTKADAAKRAAGSVTGAPGGSQPLKPNGADPSRDLRDEIRANLRAAQGRI